MSSLSNYLPSISTLDIIEAFNSTVQNSTLYSLSNTQRALQLDGQQTFGISSIATMRINVLCHQLAPIIPQRVMQIADMFSLVGALAGLGCNMAGILEAMASLTEGEQGPHILMCGGYGIIHTTTLKKIAEHLKVPAALLAPIFQHSDKVINAASLVSYVALCALGYPIQGAIGLTGLLLVALKRHALLPVLVDRYLQKAIDVAQIINAFTQPMFIFFKIINVLSACNEIYQFVSTLSLKEIIPNLSLEFLCGHY